jgi:plastocyanin
VARTKSLAVTTCLMVILAAACGKNEEPAGSEGGASFDASRGTATIGGKVTFEGAPPEMPEINMTADPVCVSLHQQPVRSEEIVVSDGRLANVFVYVKEGLEKYHFSPPSVPVELNQDGCSYVPHVAGIMVGQDLKIVNSDPTTHNVHCAADKNAQFNIGQALKGMEATRRFASPEVMVHFKCDVHKWMSAYFGVLPHPYYSVTGKDGIFTLRNLPPGEYVIEAWQEKLGTQDQKVTVRDKESLEITFTFKAAS